MRASKLPWKRAAALAVAIPILTIPISGTEGAERRVCLLDLQILGTGAGLLCTGDEATAVIDTACEAYEPIRYSRNDTEETKRAVREHNAAYDTLCKDKE